VQPHATSGSNLDARLCARDRHGVGGTASRVTRRTLLLLGLAVSSCGRPKVQEQALYGGPSLARPDQVLVYRFAVTPEQVRLDQGVTARLQRAVGDVPLRQQELEAAARVNDAIVHTLVTQLQSYGLPAMLADRPASPGVPALLVQGQLVSIDEGNRTRRTVIGLGAGHSTVTADSQLFYSARGASPRLLRTFDATDTSGHMPGMAETMGASAAAGGSMAVAAGVGAGAHTAGEIRHDSDVDDGTRLAKGLAQRIGQFCVEQGWIPATAIR